MSKPGWLTPILDAHNHTVMFRARGFVVATYGPVMAIALFFGFAQGAWYLGFSGGDAGWMARYSLLAVFPAVVLGCRLASLMLDLDELKANPLRAIVKPGFMLQGGIIGGASAMLFGAYQQGIDPLLLLDTAAFTMPLSEALGRLGCHVGRHQRHRCPLPCPAAHDRARDRARRDRPAASASTAARQDCRRHPWPV